MDRFVPITDIYAREVLDSRGYAALEVEVLAGERTVGRACVPAVASAGECGARKYEAGRKRGGGRCYGGPGAEQAVEYINARIAPELTGKNVLEQRKLDEALRHLCGAGEQTVEPAGTQGRNPGGHRERTEAGVFSGVSMGISVAAARAAAAVTGLPLYTYLGGVSSARLPVPVVSMISNTINGGSPAERTEDMRGIMILPTGARCFREELRMCTEVYHALGKLLREKGYCAAVADDGGFAPALSGAEEALSLLAEAVWRTGYCPGRDLAFALDAAASELYDPERRTYVCRDGGKDGGCPVTRTAEEMIDAYAELAGRYPIVSIEDGLEPEDREGWEKLTARMGREVQLTGGSLIASGAEGMREEICRPAANAARVELARAGTLSGLLDTIRLVRQNGLRTILSHSFGETADPVIADIAVACGASQIRAGAPCRAEQTEKYNRLLRIEEQLEHIGQSFRTKSRNGACEAGLPVVE